MTGHRTPAQISGSKNELDLVLAWARGCLESLLSRQDADELLQRIPASLVIPWYARIAQHAGEA